MHRPAPPKQLSSAWTDIIDRIVREDPDHAHEPEFYERFAHEEGWSPGR